MFCINPRDIKVRYYNHGSTVLGIERVDAARFAMLLSIPAILGAGTLKGYELYEMGNIALTNQILYAAGLLFQLFLPL